MEVLIMKQKTADYLVKMLDVASTIALIMWVAVPLVYIGIILIIVTNPMDVLGLYTYYVCFTPIREICEDTGEQIIYVIRNVYRIRR